MEGETARFIAQAKPVKQLPYHDAARAGQELGPSHNYMGNSLVPDSDMYINIRHIQQVPADYKPHVEPHTHKVNKVYAIVGDLTVEVVLDDERHEVKGPAGIFVPAGMKHSLNPLRGNGHIVVVMDSGQYE